MFGFLDDLGFGHVIRFRGSIHVTAADGEKRTAAEWNTVKRRTHSLSRQGCMLYDLIPNMPEARLRPLLERFFELLQQSRAVSDLFAVI
ncbi:MAG: DUF1073 domain-containing protein [Alphaproteobacteria bacterium]